jgi:UDP:flavonoid glycosyltransferase YjiC (YdhE family)
MQVVCPFLMDQFYWAERLCWIGAAPDPLPRHFLCPDSLDDASINAACDALRAAINHAISPEIRSQAARIAEKISSEVRLS